MDAAFDHTASGYDATFTHSEIGSRQRAIVWKYLEKHLPTQPLRILEINGGTGEDAIFLAQKGHHVTCTDIAENMVAAGRNKANDAQVKVKFQQLDITRLSEESFAEPFDLVFSNFGGLNCLDAKALQELSINLPKILQPNGQFIAVIMPRYCAWESWYFFLKLKWGKMFRRRKKGPLMVHVEGEQVPTWYYSPSRIKKLFKSHFSYKRKKPVGICIPPSYLEPLMQRNKWLLRMCSKMEGFWGRISAMSGASDHYLIELEVKQ
jgi:ubiquinone/menaquinone biosynthesis C-methylase UbiE